ncbi:MAG: hypothetical protein K0U52_13450 [Gammaproteobacteria bacterium]|nr:hypothetical protein [Gammaproteobacteria bacterium]
MNTQENNRLIAEFEGFETYEMNGYINVHYSDDNIRTIVDTHYHTSWDWLMPVVEKIESDERFDVNILQYGTIISSNTKERGHIEIVNNVANISFDSKIDHTYKAVVEFIKQYNNQ